MVAGRLARRLLRENAQPRRYVGIHVYGGMLDSRKQHLSLIDHSFHHLDAYAPSYAPSNTFRWPPAPKRQPFPGSNGSSSSCHGNCIQFPPREEGAERVCGATLKLIAVPAAPPKVAEKMTGGSRADPGALPEWPQLPPLFEALTELDAMRRSWTWRIGRVITDPVTLFRRLLLCLSGQSGQ